MASGKTRIMFPMGGLNRRAGYQDQPPYTTPDCLNVWPKDPIRFRDRGGSRPGLVRLTETPSSSYPFGTNEIRMMNQVDIVEERTNNTYPQTYTVTDNFDQGDTISSLWEASNNHALPLIYQNRFASAYLPSGSGSNSRDAIYKLLSGFDTTFPYSDRVERFALSIFIVPFEGQHWGKYRLYAYCNNTTPDPAADHGVTLEIDLSGAAGDFSGTIGSYAATTNNGTTALTDPNHSIAMAGWLTMVFYASSVPGTGANSVKAFWCGEELIDDTFANLSISSVLGSSADLRFGFGMVAEPSAGARTLVKSFTATYSTSDTGRSVKTVMFSSANGKLLRHNRLGGYEEISTSNYNLANDRYLESAEFYQNLYIADNSDLITSGTDGEFYNDSGTIRFRAGGSSPYDNWVTTHGLDAYNYSLRVEGASNAVNNGDFTINNITTVTDTNDTLTLAEGSVVTFVAETGLTFRIYRSPKRWRKDTNALTQWAASNTPSYVGLIPINCRLVCAYSDRLVLAGDGENPNVWYMSRKGTARDWDFGASDDDGSRAIASTSGGGFSTIGDPITALVPFTEDYLIFGCTNSIWQLRGDPGFGGDFVNISRTVGIVGARAWCRTPEGLLVFLSQDGVYQMAPNSIPQSFSRERLPDELRGVLSRPGLGNLFVSMAYDIRNRGIWLHVGRPTFKSDTASVTTTWFIDWETKTFWPCKFDADFAPGTMMYYNADDPEFQRILIGGHDGKIRSPYLLHGADEDDSFEGGSYVDIGPISLGGMEQEGILRELTGALDSMSGPVDWSVKTADTPEEAITATARETGEWTAGQNTVEHPRQRGESMVLRLAGGDDRPWALERITADIVPAGRQRL